MNRIPVMIVTTHIENIATMPLAVVCCILFISLDVMPVHLCDPGVGSPPDLFRLVDLSLEFCSYRVYSHDVSSPVQM
jgi:hypothetical protein